MFNLDVLCLILLIISAFAVGYAIVSRKEMYQAEQANKRLRIENTNLERRLSEISHELDLSNKTVTQYRKRNREGD